MGGWNNDVWSWGDFGINVNLLNSELTNSIVSLRSILSEAEIGVLEDDKVVWYGEPGGIFSVASCYHFYANFCIPYGHPNRDEAVLGKIWKIGAPYKIKAFSWRLILNRLPTKDLLRSRGISLPLTSLNCVFCDIEAESRNHSFFSCKVMKIIWDDIAFWIGKLFVLEEELFGNFMDWFLFCKSKKVKEEKCGIFWLAITWSIWLTRNGVCFRSDGWNVHNTVCNVKNLAWRWESLGDITKPNFSFYEFTKDPLGFLS
ncbi:uncharacterized protein LOC131598560 [Vicia villosa]|uniref:uncharacterized protein LOC131598560 n=1 Tax=Vicia villosa TaxID=3911 RepID=UPI00273BE7B2|nr:uncharacterized protein LOC131598560 [Vicia villosa]